MLPHVDRQMGKLADAGGDFFASFCRGAGHLWEAGCARAAYHIHPNPPARPHSPKTPPAIDGPK
jgi:hypothetical protein